MGHSQGGLIAFQWWLYNKPPSNLLRALSLDSPINGACSQLVLFPGPCLTPPTYPPYQTDRLKTDDPRYLGVDAARGESFRFVGTFGDSPAGGYQSGVFTLEHQLLFDYSTYSASQIESACANPYNEAGCPVPVPPDHLSECPVNLPGQPSWETAAAHYVEKFCPGDVAYFDNTFGLNY